METIDTLINARWLIPIIPENSVLDDHSIAINGGRIIDVLPSSQALMRYKPEQVHNLSEHAVTAGFVNSHTHSPMCLFRGMADDMALMDWLQKRIWPAESQWVDEQFVNDGAMLAIGEMLKSGTTCFADMYFFPDLIAKAAQAIGIRATVGLIVLDFPTIWAQNADEYISKGLALHDHFAHSTLINTIFAPHAPYTVSDTPLMRIRTLADELDIPITCHIHETAQEVRDAVQQTGQRPIQRLNSLGLLSDTMLAVHMTQLEEAEIQLLANNGVNIAHCPESNMKLASGYCPVQKLLDAGANVALGTDGAASNNDLDMLGEMRSAALLAKNVANDATALPAFTALKMATLNGARALGLADTIGSLEIGKMADIVAINLNTLQTQPVYDPISQIVYSANSSQVSDVWVAGRLLLQNHQLLSIDETQLIKTAQAWQQKISD